MVGDLAGRAVENARTIESASEDAMTDSLTGLRNARYLQGFLDQELNRARKTKRGLAVILVDLDRFKAVNDTLGHACGDDLLREVAILLRSALRNYDLAARIGGDEFVVVLPDADAAQAEVVAAKLRDAVDRHVATKRNADPDFPLVSLSAGVAVMPADGDTTEGLLAAADSRMYRDKRVKRAA
jgi:two-component system cell cycle response regulator